MALIKGLTLTLRAGGLGLVLREGLRRVFGGCYSVNGVRVCDARVFRAVRALRSRGIGWSVSGGWARACVDYGCFRVRVEDFPLLSTLAEPLKEMYGVASFLAGL